MAPTKRYICIHGHFYQPPRENPWLETVETQDTAAPYHDWNERVCAECYATNGAARSVNNKNQIIRIVNNYSRMSFNFGPTLMSWLKENAPRTYRMILDGERSSRKHFDGHSSAMAQVYNHVIMPLANRRDRITQIRWGIADYEKHYGARPEGMWLAETAADTESLELMAQHGIKFTILAPNQCRRVRPLRADANASDPAWTTPLANSVDTTRPYLMRFDSGVSIAVFFYDGATSRAIAFEGLLNSGEAFAARLKAGFKESAQPQLVNVATDGESYGHHHKHGEMALAYAVRLLEQDKTVKLTNYASFLAQFPPEWECEIVDNTSWSCAHGVERWRSNCGCSGGKPGFNQEWRKPLREALDELRDAIAPMFEQEGAKVFTDVWEARDRYIDVILDRSEEVLWIAIFRGAHHACAFRRRASACTSANGDAAARAVDVHQLRMVFRRYRRHRDCTGDRVCGPRAAIGKTVVRRTSLGDLEPAFLERLAEAKSNAPSAGDGARIYKEKVGPLQLSLEQVAAHFAISSVFSSFAEETELFCYRVRRISYDVHTSGRGRLALGRAHIISVITGHAQSFSFAVLHFGDQNITAAVKPYNDKDAAEFDAFAAQAAEQVQRADFPDVIRLIDRYYGHVDYSLTSLFSDEQRRIVQLILNSTLWDIESSLTNIYEDHASLLHYLSQAGLPKPPALTLAAEFAINAGLRRALEGDPIDQALLRSFLQLAKADKVPLDTATLSYIADQRMKRAMVELQMSAGSLEMLDRALTLARTLVELPFDLNLWQAQNIWYEILGTASYALTAQIADDRPQWDKDFNALGKCLSIDTTAMTAPDRLVEATGA